MISFFKYFKRTTHKYYTRTYFIKHLHPIIYIIGFVVEVIDH